MRVAMTPAADTTQLLHAARAGDREAFANLYSRLYDELRAIAHQRLRRSRQGETLNTAALVHEAYLKLVDQTRVDLGDRGHFLALASRAMRFIIVDHARAKRQETRRRGRRGAARHREHRRR
jgi:RNA polymerase sigma factor (TIGR02999 family)